MLSTFGLISAGKGIETAIAAMPAIVARHPEARYVIAGQTHPEVAKLHGEEYRLSLERLARDLDLGDHVVFDDRFLSIDDLASMLAATTIYLTPYRSREQIVSGALTFAIVAGCPTVSTPYFYAEDLLSSGAGVLVPFDDPPALADAVIGLLDDPERLEGLRTEARAVGAKLAWPQVGRQTADVLREALALGPPSTTRLRQPATLPRARTSHLLTMVDDVGIVQHADGIVPQRSSGYCTDDVARLAIVALGLDRTMGSEVHHRMLVRSIGFLRHAWSAEQRGMHNLMAYDRRWLDPPHRGDHLGRAAWALGEVIAAEPVFALREPSLILLRELLPVLAEQRWPRTMAFAVLGLAHAGPDTVGADAADVLRSLARRLAELQRANASPDWYWAEDLLIYDSARLSQALIAAGVRLGDAELLGEGLRSLEWYASELDIDGPCVRLVGHEGRRRGEPRPGAGDEQPLDAAALVEAEVEAFLATGAVACARRAVRAFEWFLGRNRLRASVYDFSTGGCHDGLGESDVNGNEGAESMLAFLQALLVLDAAGLNATLPDMRLAVLGPIAWRTPPRHYGPWELVTGLLADGLAQRGIDVTLFATLDSITLAKLDGVCERPYEEDGELDGRIWEALHVAHALGRSAEFDLIHNHLDWLPLAFSGLARAPIVTTVHGFSSPKILPAYLRSGSAFVSISDADRAPGLDYVATVHHGVDTAALPFSATAGDGLVCFGRIHPDKGTAQAIEIARGAGRPLVLCGPVQDERYFAEEIEPHVDGDRVRFLGSVGREDRAAVLGSGRLPAAPDRVRRAVRPLRRRVDAVRDAGRRLRSRVDARARRGWRHRRPGRRRRVGDRGRRARRGLRPRGLPQRRRAAFLRRPHGRRLRRCLRRPPS